MRRFSQPSVATQKFARTTSQVLNINPSTGFNATGFDLEMVFSLASTSFFSNGTALSVASNPGSSDFTALYDFYRLDKVEVAFMYSANTVSPAALSGMMLPILNIVFDPSDSSTISLSSILQYQNLHTVQLGNLRTQDGYVVACRPRPAAFVASGSGGTAVGGGVETPLWISKDLPNVNYYGIKAFYDNAGSTLNAVSGTITIYTKYFWSFKLSQ